MLRLVRACVFVLAFALIIPAVARATPMTFEFRGEVTQIGYADRNIPAIHNPFIGILEYDTDAPTVYDDRTVFGYSGGSFELTVNGITWSSTTDLFVSKNWFHFENNSLQVGAGGAGFILDASGTIPHDGSLPTAIDLGMLSVAKVYARSPGSNFWGGEITSITRVQEPVAVSASEPATLTLSAFGLAALAARRRAQLRSRVMRVWHAGGEVFHAAKKARP